MARRGLSIVSCRSDAYLLQDSLDLIVDSRSGARTSGGAALQKGRESLAADAVDAAFSGVSWTVCGLIPDWNMVAARMRA